MSNQEERIFIEPNHELTERLKYQQRSHQIIRIDGQGCFLEVLNGHFHKGKILMNFEQYDDSKPKGQRTISRIMYFMPFDKFLQLSQDCKSGRLSKLAVKEKSENKYPNPIFRDLTGTSKELLEKNNQSRPDGKSESRQFKITPGLKADFLFQAEKGPGEEAKKGKPGSGDKDSKGIIQPLYGGSPEVKIDIPMSNDSMKKLFLMVETHIIAYLASQYNIRALRIEEERNSIDTLDVLSKLGSLSEISKELDKISESYEKILEIEKTLNKINKMTIKIGEIVSDNKKKME